MRMWPTPTASDYRGAQTVAGCKAWRSRGRNLPEAVVLEEAREHQFKASTQTQESLLARGPSQPPSPACPADNRAPAAPDARDGVSSP